MTQIKEKIAFKLSTPEAVEYANAHSKNGAGRYELCNDHYFHLPHFDVYEGLYGHSALTILPGYTDVTPNFLEDYYRPWKDKLASDNAPSIVPCDAPVDDINTDQQIKGTISNYKNASVTKFDNRRVIVEQLKNGDIGLCFKMMAKPEHLEKPSPPSFVIRRGKIVVSKLRITREAAFALIEALHFQLSHLMPIEQSDERTASQQTMPNEQEAGLKTTNP
jgi:hypothetical protein